MTGKHDGQRPERAVGQPHFADDSLVIGLLHEGRERRKAADGEQLEITQSALVEGQAGKVFRGRLHLGGALVADDQIDEFSSVTASSALPSMPYWRPRLARGRDGWAPFNPAIVVSKIGP